MPLVLAPLFALRLYSGGGDLSDVVAEKVLFRKWHDWLWLNLAFYVVVVKRIIFAFYYYLHCRIISINVCITSTGALLLLLVLLLWWVLLLWYIILTGFAFLDKADNAWTSVSSKLSGCDGACNEYEQNIINTSK